MPMVRSHAARKWWSRRPTLRGPPSGPATSLASTIRDGSRSVKPPRAIGIGTETAHLTEIPKWRRGAPAGLGKDLNFLLALSIFLLASIAGLLRFREPLGIGLALAVSRPIDHDPVPGEGSREQMRAPFHPRPHERALDRVRDNAPESRENGRVSRPHLGKI